MGIGRSSQGKAQAPKAKISSMDVCREGENTRSRWRVPIVFVPGVMGTRLEFTDIDERWNPDSTWDMLHWLRVSAERERQEMHFQQPALVMTGDTNEALGEDELGLGWEGMAWDFYVPFLRFLKSQSFRLAESPIYAVGYDWRQDIGFLGDVLAKEIDNILQQTDSTKAIIVTHSMGGLVTRAAMKINQSLASKVLGVIHVVQPAVGATVAYRRFFTGAISALDGGWGLSTIIGNTGEKYSTIMSGLTGPTQLMPSNLLRDRDNKPWMYYRENGIDKPYQGDVFDLYSNAQSPPGLMAASHATTGQLATVRTELMARIEEARGFHNWLADFKHDTTYAAFSTGVATDMAIVFDPPSPPADGSAWENRGARPVRRLQGDGTVPDTSASVLFPGELGPIGDIPSDEISTSPRQCGVNGVEHSDAFNNADVRRTVVSWVNRMLFENVSARSS